MIEEEITQIMVYANWAYEIKLPKRIEHNFNKIVYEHLLGFQKGAVSFLAILGSC